MLLRKTVLAALLVTTLVVVFMAGRSTAHTQQPNRRDIYTMYRISPEAPLSVVFRGRCIEAEDSAAHLKLVEYGDGVAVYGCRRVGY